MFGQQNSIKTNVLALLLIDQVQYEVCRLFPSNRFLTLIPKFGANGVRTGCGTVENVIKELRGKGHEVSYT